MNTQKEMNFTQFANSLGLPCDYDTMFKAQLLGGRGLAGSISKRSVKSQDNEFCIMQAKNKEAHKLFESAILSGEIIDASGKITRSGLINSEIETNKKAINSRISAINSYLSLVLSMKTSYLKSGKLKKSYQLAVNDHNNEKAILENQLINL